MAQAFHFWRILRVGLIYVFWAVGVVTVIHAVIPIGCIFAAGRAGEDLFAQRCLHRFARMVLRAAVMLGVIELTVDCAERLERPGPMVVVANHPTMLDATLIVALTPQIDNVVEKSWADAPIVGDLTRKADYLRNDSVRTVIAEAARRLHAGRRLLIFPEGSRSPIGALHPFRRGAASIALSSGCDPIPVVIRCEPPIGLKGKAWYDIPRDTPKMSVSVGDPISLASVIEGGDSRGMAARKVNTVLRDHFLRELNYADA